MMRSRINKRPTEICFDLQIHIIFRVSTIKVFTAAAKLKIIIIEPKEHLMGCIFKVNFDPVLGHALLKGVANM
jgi:hypothetical protein